MTWKPPFTRRDTAGEAFSYIIHREFIARHTIERNFKIADSIVVELIWGEAAEVLGPAVVLDLSVQQVEPVVVDTGAVVCCEAPA